MNSKPKGSVAKKRAKEIENPDVDAIFRAYPKELRAKLAFLRQLIFATALATDGVDELEETLKWGQPSYLTTSSRSGSTIRIAPVKSDPVKSDPTQYAMYLHCQTNLVATFREIYPTELEYGGNRSIIFNLDDEIAEEALRHCVSLALTYRLRKARHR